MTVITGLEAFGVPLDEFAEELRKLCAGSTTSTRKPHEKKSADGSSTAYRGVAKVEPLRIDRSRSSDQSRHRCLGGAGRAQTVDQGGHGQEEVDKSSHVQL